MADSSKTSETRKDSESPDETKKVARSGTQPEVKVEATVTETKEEEMTAEEMLQLWTSLKKMGIKPENFMAWTAGSTVKQKETAVPKTPTPFYKPPLRLSVFSGDKKSDVSYDLWKYEVICLMKEAESMETVLQSIRRSVKGEAAHVVMRLGVSASVDEILHKFDSIYGNVMEKEDVLAEFYSAKQREDETCSAWSCRLEEILNRAMMIGKVQSHASNEMLRTMFYKGMRQDLKDICGYLYHSIHDFDILRIEVRKIETEHPSKTVSSQSKVKQGMAKNAIVKQKSDVEDDRFEALQAQINQLKTQQEYYQPPSQGSYFNKRGRQPYVRGNRQQFRGRGRGYSHRLPEPKSFQTSSEESIQKSDNTTCYRCGQEGHIAIGCRVRLDHKKSLNFRLPNPGDKDLAERGNVPQTRMH